jgi:hypothetical protein
MTTVLEIKTGGKEPWHRLQAALYSAGKADPEIGFQEDGHAYTYRGRVLKSVTQIVNPNPNAFYAPGSADRGKKVHAMCMLDAQGILDLETVDESFLGYLKAWRDFRADMVEKFIALEQVVGDPRFGFAGRLDALVELKRSGFPGLVVYIRKTGTYCIDLIKDYEFGHLRAKALGMAQHAMMVKRFNMWEGVK